MHSDTIEATLRDWFTKEPRVVFLTGAGISAESGVPTFRGAGGLWKQYRAEDLATPEAFRRDPALVWEWYNMRRGAMAPARPNPGHEAIARLQAVRPGTALITQNVDGLHRLAGRGLTYELHGCIWETRCSRCRDVREDRRVPLPYPPACEACGGMLRPNVVWFGESLDPIAMQGSHDSARECDLFIVAGTSGTVYPAASFVPIAAQAGARVIEINPDETPLSAIADLSLRAPSGETLPFLINTLLNIEA